MNPNGITIDGVYYPLVTCLRGTYYRVDLDRVGELREEARAVQNEADEKYRMSRCKEHADLYYGMRDRSREINRTADDLLVASDARVKAGLPPVTSAGLSAEGL
jgi:hypothetical protein